MRQATLKFKGYMRGYAPSVNIINNNNLQRKALHTIFASLILLSLCYAFFLGSMVLNIIKRKNLDSEARTLSNQISGLELSYFAKSNQIDITLSQSMGFKETKTNFATRKTSLGSLKIANNEI